MKRNLLFHLYPKRRSCWKWHVEQLLSYVHVWNGRRIVTVVLDDWTENGAVVMETLAPLQAEVFVAKNDRELGEVAHFIQMLGLLESLDPDEATFYAHGKGVSHEGPELSAIQMWTKAMYVLNLEYIGQVEKELVRAAVAGAFRVQINHSGAKWCYAGTFFWLKHSALFSRNWRDIEPIRFGTEGYPGRHFVFEESAALTPDIMEHRFLPGWLYGANGGSGVTDGHLNLWRELLSRRG